jgi:DNA polymerase III subunit alpha
MDGFVHLHLHTEYSISDGIGTVPALMEAALARNIPALAMTDQSNLFAAVKFYREAIKAGIKPILGVDIYLKPEKENQLPGRLTLLAKDQIGYKNIIELVSNSYLAERIMGLPVVEKAWLFERNSGIIVLSSWASDFSASLRNQNQTESTKILAQWQKHFGDRFYFEVQRTKRPGEENYLAEVFEYAHHFKVPIVATNDVRFVNRDDFEAHEARYCIHAGQILSDPKRKRLYQEEQYLKSAEEMQDLFSDLPEAIANSLEIAKRCNVELRLGETFLPVFNAPNNLTAEDYLKNQAEKGLKERLSISTTNIAPEKYQERLQYELDVINKMGFAGYFLIVSDFIAWAKANDIPVGPGRGSGAGSLAAYSLGITALDPLAHELLFERFLNPERISLPDFDIDFCMEGRDRVIEYVSNKYGKEKVSQIITYGTMAARAVVRDVGRVLGYPYGFVDKLAKLIPFELGINLDRAMGEEETLKQRYRDEEEVKVLIDLAKKLEGITRNASKHAGGVVIAPSRLTDFAPLYREESEANAVTQFDKDDVEAVGLVKFDFLGLRTLTIIKRAVNTINQKRKPEEFLMIETIPLDDRATYRLIQNCETAAVFQIESRGMRDLIRRLKPDCFEDLVAVVALFRPGPMMMADDFIARKSGKSPVTYPHKNVVPILRTTYGVILYQEQVMQIAQEMAGYSLGGADILRKAMGKKQPEEMAKQRAVFLEGASKKGIDKHLANSVFDLMEKFAGYGFNKSHSAAYALLAYQTAWLKAHFPSEFMAAVLSSDLDNTDKVAQFIFETKKMGIKILPPDINKCGIYFTVNQSKEIVYGLGAIKGVGMAALEIILAARNDKSFDDLFDFCARVDLRKVNRKVLEALIKAGAFDQIGPDRARIFDSIDVALQHAEQNVSSQKGGQLDLFSEAQDEDITNETRVSYGERLPWSNQETLDFEKSVLGVYLNGHPFEKYLDEACKMGVTLIFDLVPRAKKMILIAGLIAGIKVIYTKSGNKMAIVTLEDTSSRIEITFFSDLYQKSLELLAEGKILVVSGQVEIDDFTGNQRMRALEVMNFEKARNTYAQGLMLKLQREKIPEDFLIKLKTYAKKYRGKSKIYFQYQNEKASAVFSLGEEWKVMLDDEFLALLKSDLGEENVLVCY